MNLTRKEIARRTGLSARAVRSNERKLGLDQIKVNVNKRVVLYPERQALRALRSRGLEA
jgi:hypothetical protein